MSLNNGKWNSKNRILNNLAVIILNKGIFYSCARIDLWQRSKFEVMSHTKAQEMMTLDWLCTNVWSATDNADTSVVWLSPDWSVNSIIECDWSAKTFTIMGPITVQWLYSVTVWAQSLYSADVFLSVAIFLRRRPQFVMIVTCPDKERHCS